MIRTRTLFFDIETGPLPEDQLRLIEPVFEPGLNLKDPEKIKADIERKRARWFADAALSSLTGEVLAIGTAHDGGPVEIIGGITEDLTLCQFWRLITDGPGTMNICGFCITSFDLPFLFHRSWRHGLEPPVFALHPGRWWSERVIDLRETWTLGARDIKASLADVAATLGLPPKLGTGDEFAALWKSDRKKAEEYLRRDIEITRAMADIIEHGRTASYARAA